MRLTSRQLKKLHACPREVAWFRRKYPRGLDINEASILSVLATPNGRARVQWLIYKCTRDGGACNHAVSDVVRINGLIDESEAANPRRAQELRKFVAFGANAYIAGAAMRDLSTRRAVRRLEAAR